MSVALTPFGVPQPKAALRTPGPLAPGLGPLFSPPQLCLLFRRKVVVSKPLRRPRALTLTLPEKLQPYLVLEGKQYILRNFSEEGMGVWVPEPAPFELAKGNQVSGDIVIGSQIHPVQLEVMFQGKGIVGLRIVHKSVELGELFRRLLEPTQYASELVAHPLSGQVDKTVGFPRLWYRTQGTELLVWYDPATRLTVGLQLRWLGQWVFRERNHATHTGYLEAFEQPDHGGRAKGKEILIAHNPGDPELLQRAGQFLVSVPSPLPGYVLWQFLESGKPMELPAALLPANQYSK
jgi:hypothetical protein